MPITPCEYFQIIDELDGDIESRRAAFNYTQDSTAIVHHQVVASSLQRRACSIAKPPL